MTEYNEIKLLALSKGRCSQDNCYLKEITYEQLPQEIRTRHLENITECFVVGDHDIICLFRNDMVKRVDLRDLSAENEKIAGILKNGKLMSTLEVGAGGYGITFNKSIDINKSTILEKGTKVHMSAQAFYSFVHQNIVDTAQACEMLQCTKQNLTHLIKTGKLQPIKEGLKENLFYRGDVERYMWG